jgi:hypothetical protein
MKTIKLKFILIVMITFFMSTNNTFALDLEYMKTKEKPKLIFKQVKDGIYLVNDTEKCWFHYVVADEIGEAIKKYANNQSIGFNSKQNELQCKYLLTLQEEV